MRPIRPTRPEALYNVSATRVIEQLATSSLPPHCLMARAGLAVAQLARALAPHAGSIWIACGPGNNGGDGLIAATHLHQWAQARGGSPRVVVTHWAGASSQNRPPPSDALNALGQAQAAGVVFAQHPPENFDLAIDALFGIGVARAPEGLAAQWIELLRHTAQTVLCVDVPSGLDADTGTLFRLPAETLGTAGSRHTLSLLTLKPGLFTASGRDAAGQVWLDDLCFSPPAHIQPTAHLNGWTVGSVARAHQPHVKHKGSFGDVLVVGGQDMAINGAGMTGAAVLAARAALHAGAGRVFVALLEGDSAPATSAIRWDPACPELMFRDANALLESPLLATAAVVCGCGGGTAVVSVLPKVLSHAHALVLDADALNAIAGDRTLQVQLSQRSARGCLTVLTPHPLEAARLLACSTVEVMSNRLQAAQALSERFATVCVLKGSGTVISALQQTPLINPTGNAALATAGTGDVLAGMLGSALALPGATSGQLQQRLAQAVFQHGWLADQWPLHAGTQDEAWYGVPALSASRLARRVHPLQ